MFVPEVFAGGILGVGKTIAEDNQPASRLHP
jgi:hypothetical protein